MTEQDYIAVSDLAKLKIAEAILRDCAIFQGDTIEEARRLVMSKILFLQSNKEQ